MHVCHMYVISTVLYRGQKQIHRIKARDTHTEKTELEKWLAF